MNKDTHRQPVFLSLEQRKKYEELAQAYRSIAGKKTGNDAIAAYENSAFYYELIRNHALAQKMRQFANTLKSKNHLHITNNSLAASIISVGILGALTLFYSGFSGNAIADSGSDTMNWFGVGLLLAAIAFGIFYILKKKRK